MSTFLQSKRYITKLSLMIFAIVNMQLQILAYAEELNDSPKVHYTIPAGQLGKALSQFAGKNGLTFSFDPKVVEGKQTSGLNGEYSIKEGFNKLLDGSGLSIGVDLKGGYYLQKATLKESGKPVKDVEIELKKTVVKANRFKDIGPMPGLALTKDQIAGNIQSISAKEIKEAHSLSLADLLNSKLQSVNVNDYQGNPFQMDVTYRGFTASPQIGSPQGLSVFFDGIRVNEPFGDVMNWDMIPMNALGSFDVFPGSNPIFGLNTLGGALSMRTKSGFTDSGVSAEVLTGSFGRRQLQVSGGWNNGQFAAFGAGNFFLEDGWRENSPSKVNQAFGKLEWQGEKLSLGLSSLAVVNKLVGNGTVPQELYRQDPSAVFTSPDITRNRLLQFQITGAFDVNDNINITGMVYNRKSDRIQKTGDIVDFETFNTPDAGDKHVGSRRARPGETITCALSDSNRDGVPDYFVINEADYPTFANEYSINRTINFGLLTENEALPPDLQTALQQRLSVSPILSSIAFAGIEAPSILGGFVTEDFFLRFGDGFAYDDGAGNIKRVFAKLPVNAASCSDEINGNLNGRSFTQGVLAGELGIDGRGKARDGSGDFTGGFTGVVAGTPTAIITNSNIAQNGQGGALQLNFNFDQHKLMVGASLDKAKASYVGKQRLAQVDNNRNVFNDPEQLGEEYFAADHDITINDFAGTSLTKSIYASETWSPTQNLNFSISGRYNYSDIKNTLAPRIAERLLTDFTLYNRFPGGAVVCPGTDISQCPIDLSKPIESDQFNLLGNFTNYLLPPATEKFSYHKFNPAIGVTWQAKPNLNMYANWNQGTRVPSVIELGCAYDDTLVPTSPGEPNSPLVPRSLLEGRGCSLPSALSGDPYLPQVVAKTIEVGARGKFADFLEWNISAYRTNVVDDIYLTSLTPELSFFQSIGDTRRQGIEFGLAGEYGKSDFRINYSLTEATFQSSFRALSPNNSSRQRVGAYKDTIEVEPGNVMPGVPFNNINLNWGYKVTPKFKINTSVVAHSDSFLRGNENNAHTPSQGQVVQKNLNNIIYFIKEPDNNYAGKAPGYAVVNMSARYDFGSGWEGLVLINNVLDKTYYTAGRLGITPFAPSTFGAIGPGGFNYNSSEWIPTQFISAGAPRGIWMSLSYDFNKDIKPVLTQATIPEPDRTLDQPSELPSASELALIKQLDAIKALPVLKLAQSATLTAKQEVSALVEKWHTAQINQNTDLFLNSYSTTYAPSGVSHNQWVEQQKMRFVTDKIQQAALTDIVVVPEDKRMVAIFHQMLSHGASMERMRKILTFEQRQGQWVIVSEHAMPASKNSTNKNSSNKANQAKSGREKAMSNKATQLTSFVAEVK